MAPESERRSVDSNSDTLQIGFTNAGQPENPQNWSIPRKLFHTIVPCLLAFEITFSTSVTVPSTQSIMMMFDVSRIEATLALTLYTIGVGFGPLFIAPLSEVFGRRWIYIMTTSFFMAFTGGAAAAQNFATLLVCRFLAGLLGSAGIAIGAGTLSDIWPLGKQGATAGLFFILGPFLGPTLGPLAGAYILSSHDQDWRWSQYLILFIGAPVWVGCLLMSETSPKNTRQNGVLGESDVGAAPVRSRLTMQDLLRPFRMLLTDPITSSLTVYTAYAYAMIFAYFSSSSDANISRRSHKVRLSCRCRKMDDELRLQLRTGA